MASGDGEPGDPEGRAGGHAELVERLRAVAAAAAGVVSADRLDTLQDVVREQLRRVVPFDAFTFGLYDAETGLIHFEAGRDGDLALTRHDMPVAATPSEQVIRSRRSLLIRRSDDPRAHGATLTGTDRRSESVIRTPIMTSDEVLGVISVQSYTPDRYTAEDIELLETMAALAATAILNIRHLDERRAAEAALRQSQQQTQRLAARLRAAADLAAGLVQAKSLHTLQAVMRDACAQVIPLDYCTLGLYDPETDSLRYEESVDAGRPVEGPEVLPVGGTPGEHVLRERRSMLTRRSTDPAAQGAAIVGTGRRSESAIRTPVVAGDRVLGLVSVQSYTPDLYDDQDVEVLEAMAALAATAILNMEYLHQQEALEAQLRQAHKMEAIGRLAGGIAHDFNNLLTTIQGNIALVLSDLTDDDALRLELKEIEAAADRAARLTRQLLAFGRQQVLLPQELDLNRQIEQVRGLSLRVLPSNIRLRTRLDPLIGLVKADPGQIDQVLLNLVVNARDAIPDGGTIEIETRNLQVSDAEAPAQAPLTPGDYVVVEVHDTGVGMDEWTLNNAFEPFFSTKPSGQGTGLGLATVQGIIEQSGGHIRAESTPGEGSRFTVHLPRVEASLETTVARPQPDPAARGTETLLLVEDERPVRDLARRVLERCGYTVVEAADGQEALDLFARNTTRVDLLLTDVMMPRMGGHALAASLRASEPSLRVLFMSGYAGDMIHDHQALTGPTSFIQKPFTPRLLARAVRTALDRPVL
jgi:signal transduction histidine kinase